MKKRILSAISIVLMGTLMVFVSCKEEQKNPPLIKDVEVTGDGPFIVKATILDDNGALKSAELFYKKSTETTFTTVNMVKGDANVYSAEIPAQDPTTVINYYIKAVNSVDLTTFEPAGAPETTLQFEVGGINYKGIVLNEIWAGAPSDEEKFIELFNKTDKDIDISGVFFKRNGDAGDGVVGTIPDNTTLKAGKYYILGTKNNTTNPNDPNAPYDHSISKGFSAKKSILFEMFDPSGNRIDFFLRGSMDNLDSGVSDLAPKSYSRIPNGTGEWKAVDNATLRAENDPTGAMDIPND